MHIMEPWWNNAVERQVIGRGIRICSHEHIAESEFIDFSLDAASREYNTKLVNVCFII